ncbi:Thioester-containing protein 2 [Carabus blaptoides fortunei]
MEISRHSLVSHIPTGIVQTRQQFLSRCIDTTIIDDLTCCEQNYSLSSCVYLELLQKMKRQNMSQIMTSNIYLQCQVFCGLTLNSTFTKRQVSAEPIGCFEIDVPQTNNSDANVQVQIKFSSEAQPKTIQTGKVVIVQNSEITFVQTDRNIFKPGDLVRIRILLYNSNLSVPSKLVIPVIKIRNPLQIVVAQWNNVSTELGLVQLEHQLAEESMLGSWSIELPENGRTSKSFEVKEYTLPRFDVTLSHPSRFNKESEFKVTVCSKYTYGAPVKGSARLTIQSYYNHELLPRDKELVNGCAEFIYDRKAVQKMSYNVDLSASIKEQGTDQIEKASSNAVLAWSKYSLQTSSENFQPGMPSKGKVTVKDSLIDLTEISVQICYKFAFGISHVEHFSKPKCKRFPISEKNETEFVIFPTRSDTYSIEINVSQYEKEMNEMNSYFVVLQAQIENDSNVQHTVDRWYSPSNSYIQISDAEPDKQIKCNTEHPFTVTYTLNNNTVLNSPKDFYYLIKSKGDIIKLSKTQQTITAAPAKKYINTFDTNVPSLNLGEFTLPIKIEQQMYSEAELLVYYVHKDGEVVGNSIKFKVENCFANKVEAGWTESQKYPGETTAFNIKAAPGSLCAINAVDKSTHIMSAASNLNEEMLLSRVAKPNTPSYQERVKCKDTQDPAYDYEEFDTKYDYPPFSDTSEILNDMNLLVLTSLTTVTKPCVANKRFRPVSHKYASFGGGGSLMDSPPSFSAFSAARPVSAMLESNSVSDSVDMGVPIRSYFPETWLFDLVPINSTGETKLIHDIPHTITQWIGNTYCVSPSAGVGVAPTSYITSFKPFFVDLLAPYAIKRNEVSHLKVISFNYLNHSLPIKVSLDLNENIQLVDSPSSFTACLGPSDSVTFVFKAKALVDGNMNVTVTTEVDPELPAKCGVSELLVKKDVIIKNILVKVEGFPIEETNSSYVCLNEHTTEADKNINWPMALPENAVPNYARVNTLLDADLMELTIGNIGSILQMPAGCGEQIMATLAPNLYILRYLKALNKLTPEIEAKIYGFMKTGYERILGYRHFDGSFSVFGEGNTESSIFLTAFVMRVLAQSSKYVHIDDDIIKKAQMWIRLQQDEKGCFPPALRKNYYENTRNDPIALTAYVLISVHDAEVPLPPNRLDEAKVCLSGGDSSNKYQMAISAYALLLNGATAEANKILEKLLKISNKEQNLVWWEDPYSTANSVETTAYAILALMSSDNVEYKGVAHSAIRWLLTKRNPTGGFISTQDTVVALNALTEYALLMEINTNLNLSITVETDNKKDTYNINKALTPRNKQLTRKEFSKFVNFKLEGTGCVLIQNTLRYNMPQIKSSDVLKLDVNVAQIWRNDKCDFANVTLCVAYSVPNENINMALLELNLPSGYGADRYSLNSLSTYTSAFKRYELKDDKVILYYSELNNNTVCTSFLINEQSIIENRTSSIVRIYDYYNPILYASTSYDIPECVKPTRETKIVN